MANSALPVLDLSKADDLSQKQALLDQLHDALFNVGFLYIKNHGVSTHVISNLVSRLPALFDQPAEAKLALSKQNSPHFLGYSGYAEEVTLGMKDLREQFDFATELPVIWDPSSTSVRESQISQLEPQRDFSRLYWLLRGPNQWPLEDHVPGFRRAFTELALPIQRKTCTG